MPGVAATRAVWRQLQFIDASEGIKPKREWVGWMAVTRVSPVDSKRVDVAGRLVDMDEMDRGMLGLYLSTQPLAA